MSTGLPTGDMPITGRACPGTCSIGKGLLGSWLSLGKGALFFPTSGSKLKGFLPAWREVYVCTLYTHTYMHILTCIALHCIALHYITYNYINHMHSHTIAYHNMPLHTITIQCSTLQNYINIYTYMPRSDHFPSSGPCHNMCP